MKGSTVLQYFISTHGARKGLADTALKTADSGYLTRRLVDVAQDVIIAEPDCGTLDGIESRAIVEGGEIIEPLRDRIIGRVSIEKLVDPVSGETIVEANGEINEELSQQIEEAGFREGQDPLGADVRVAPRRVHQVLRPRPRDRQAWWSSARRPASSRPSRSASPARSSRCARSTSAARRAVSEQTTQEARYEGVVRFEGLQTVDDGDGGAGRHEPQRIARRAGREGPRPRALPGGLRREAARQGRPEGRSRADLLLEWDPYTFSILTEEPGTVRYKDIIDGVTVHEEIDEITGLSRRIIIDSPDEKKQPAIEIRGADNKVIRRYHMPSHAHLMVDDGDTVSAGAVLAKIPRETTKTKDITGGLPRVVELFEARQARARRRSSPRSTASSSTADRQGPAEDHRRPRGRGEQREYSIPRGVHVNVQEGERVRAGRAADGRPARPARHPQGARRERAAESTWSTRSRRSTGCRASHQRQAHRDDRPSDAAVGEDRGRGRHRVPRSTSRWTSSGSSRRTSA